MTEPSSAPEPTSARSQQRNEAEMRDYVAVCPDCGGWAKKLVYKDQRPMGYECHKGHRWDWRTGEMVSGIPTFVVPMNGSRPS